MRETELFVISEQVLVEVVGRIRAEHWKLVLPPLFDRPGADKPLPLRAYVLRHAVDDARVPQLLAGETIDPDRSGVELLGPDPHATVARLADVACAAARDVDEHQIVHSDLGDVPARDFLRHLTITRSFVAHDIAMHLGSRACPLTEELSRAMWERTEPAAAHWRKLGIFREPLAPVPADVSWRDRFLMSAGRDPHALDH